MTVSIKDNPELNRFEATVSDTIAGFAEYQLAKGLVVFTHAEVDHAYEGTGIGSALVRFALDDVRDRNLEVSPICPFIASWIDRHPEYADLVDGPRSSTVTE